MSQMSYATSIFGAPQPQNMTPVPVEQSPIIAPYLKPSLDGSQPVASVPKSVLQTELAQANPETAKQPAQPAQPAQKAQTQKEPDLVKADVGSTPAQTQQTFNPAGSFAQMGAQIGTAAGAGVPGAVVGAAVGFGIDTLLEARRKAEEEKALAKQMRLTALRQRHVENMQNGRNAVAQRQNMAVDRRNLRAARRQQNAQKMAEIYAAINNRAQNGYLY